MIGDRVGHQAQMALIEEVTRGAYQLELFSSEDMGHAKRIMERYADLRIGLADASEPLDGWLRQVGQLRTAA